MTTQTETMLSDYLKQAGDVFNAQTELNVAKQALIAAKDKRLYEELRLVIDDVECAAYIALGTNETARKDRRALWMADALADLDIAVEYAERVVMEAEANYDYARHKLTYLRLVLEADRGD